MDDKVYFFTAVSIAIVVPVVFGGIYFFKTAEVKENSSYVSILSDKTELLTFGNTIIDDKVEDTISNNYEFSVMYASGIKKSVDYVMYLDNVILSENLKIEDICWNLYKYNDNSKKYELNTSNVLEEPIDDEEIKFRLVSDNIEKNGSVNKYRLYYSINNPSFIEGSIKANIIVEEE